MKLPKSVIICGYKWKIVQVPEDSGGWFVNGEKTIYIGGKIEKEKTEIFLHEVIEAILSDRGMRYSIYATGTNDRLLFSFYHYEFESIIKDITLALQDILKS